MTYSQKEFYKTSSGQNQKPSAGEASKTRERSVKLLASCIESVRQLQAESRLEKQLRAKLIGALSLAVKYATSHRWADENLPPGSLTLKTAQAIVEGYYSIPVKTESTDNHLKANRSNQRRKKRQDKKHENYLAAKNKHS